jgi:CysZ protein
MTQSTPAQIVQGITAPFRGLRIVLGHPAMWGLAVLPIVLTVVFLGIAVSTAVVVAAPLTSWLLPSLEHPLLRGLATGLLVGLLGLVLGMTAYMSATLLSIPINDALSERVEDQLGALPPPISLRESLPRSIRHSVAGFLCWLGITVLLLPLQLVPGIGSLLGTVLGFLVTGWFFAHQLLDGPMSRRGMGFRAKMVFLREHLPWVMGIGCTGALVMLIPLANLVALPVFVAGGAVLWVELERDRRSALPDHGGSL